MKKVLSIALALLMVCVILPVTAMAALAEGETCVAKIGDEQYGSLQAAIDAVQDGDTIVMQVATYTEGGIGIFSSGAHANAYDKSFTIDFNGCVMTGENPLQGSAGTESQAFHLEGQVDKTITMKNGTITSTTARLLVMNYRNLNLVNMVLDGRNLPKAYYGTAPNQTEGKVYTLSNCGGTVNIEGNTSIYARVGAEGDTYVENVAFDADNKNSVDVTVNTTGSITGEIELTKRADKPNNTANLTITNGTFSDDVTAYTPADKLVVTDDTNYYVGATATSVVSNATSGTFTVINGTNVDLTVKGGVTIVNGTGPSITVNGKLVNEGGSITVPSTITIIVPSEGGTTATTPAADDQKNPATGANDFVGVAAAVAAMALLGSAVVLRKK